MRGVRGSDVLMGAVGKTCVAGVRKWSGIIAAWGWGMGWMAPDGRGRGMGGRSQVVAW